ncbi:MAG: SGNH/GDSL hydrolase family protein [Chthoniobacterales bacterium]
MTRTALTLLAIACCLGCFVLVTNGTARTAVKRPASTPTGSAPTRVLMIGDSLSAGPFGEAVQQHLAIKFGPSNVAAYASCGSSPEHWLAAEPGFYTKCGYRQSTPDQAPVFRDFVNGKAPAATLTPKLETLVRRHQPTVVVAQLGTNWMDRDLSDAQINSFTSRFITAARGSSVRQIIWIAPPDSSALRKRQGRIHRLIQQAGERYHFEVIDSRQLTRYVPGKTGGDGIHYNTASSQDWAERVNDVLDTKLRVQMASRR